MADSKSSSKLHVAVFPWFAFGHFTPALHLSNKLAQRGHKVSFLIPKGTQHKIGHLNQHPHLIHFFPLLLPPVQGLPLGAETASDVPFPLLIHLWTEFDQTRNQVTTILSTIKPDFVIHDVAYWLPPLARELGIKPLLFVPASAAWVSLRYVPAAKIVKDMTEEELMQPPPGYPSSSVVPRPDEIAMTKILAEDFSSGSLSFRERLITCARESDAIAIRTCSEIEGHFCNYISQQYKKSVLPLGPVLPEKQIGQLDKKLADWLGNYNENSVVYCAFGSEYRAQKEQFQELLLGFELSGLPFLVALRPPYGCSSVEEAFPEGFEERVRGRGWVYGGWVPQPLILGHSSVGCFVTHCGFGSLWESLLSDCQLVLVPFAIDQTVNAMLMVKELKVAVEVNKEENGWISKESLSNAIKVVMDEKSTKEVGGQIKTNHARWKKILSDKNMQETYIDNFIQNLDYLLE